MLFYKTILKAVLLVFFITHKEGGGECNPISAVDSRGMFAITGVRVVSLPKSMVLGVLFLFFSL